MTRTALLLVTALLVSACKGDEGPAGNQGSVGAPGATGPAGTIGAAGPVGEPGQDGPDGLPGGTPYLVTNAFDGVIQYGDGAQIIPLGDVTLVPPMDGGFLVRVHYRGAVAKRDGTGFCNVSVRVRQDGVPGPLLEERVGVRGAPVAGRLELSVGGSMQTLVQAPAGAAVTLRLEIQRFDDNCADGAGPEQIARIAAQVDATFHRFVLATE